MKSWYKRRRGKNRVITSIRERELAFKAAIYREHAKLVRDNAFLLACVYDLENKLCSSKDQVASNQHIIKCLHNKNAHLLKFLYDLGYTISDSF